MVLDEPATVPSSVSFRRSYTPFVPRRDSPVVGASVLHVPVRNNLDTLHRSCSLAAHQPCSQKRKGKGRGRVGTHLRRQRSPAACTRSRVARGSRCTDARAWELLHRVQTSCWRREHEMKERVVRGGRTGRQRGSLVGCRHELGGTH